MNHVRIWAKAKLDNSGSEVSIPIILVHNNGELTALEPLVRYVINHIHIRSHSWMTKLCAAVGKLLDYVETNRGVNDKPVTVFEGFVNALYSGTFNSEGEDPSGLCWMPSDFTTVEPKLYMIEELSDWMVREGYISACLNPWTEATSTERRFNWIAWYRRNQYSFLGHIGCARGASIEIQQARTIKSRRRSSGNISAPKSFPANYEITLLRDGFIQPGKEKSKDILEKYDWRCICIAMLLLYGARRVSEPFHLWVGDVLEQPDKPGNALVRIYHPQFGQAPDQPRIKGNRAPNRQAYLQAFFPQYLPRNNGTGNYHAGFKSRAFTDDKAKFLHVFWYPTEYGEAFLHAYVMYMRQRAKLGINAKKHPFAFVSHKGKFKGEPYSISSFEKKWKRAIHRIGLPHQKFYGTTTHGPRHGYGKRANQGGVGISELQEAFAHSSPDSQLVYRVPSVDEITQKLDAASTKIQRGEAISPENKPTESEFFNLRTIWATQDKRDQNRHGTAIKKKSANEK